MHFSHPSIEHFWQSWRVASSSGRKYPTLQFLGFGLTISVLSFESLSFVFDESEKLLDCSFLPTAKKEIKKYIIINNIVIGIAIKKYFFCLLS